LCWIHITYFYDSFSTNLSRLGKDLKLFAFGEWSLTNVEIFTSFRKAFEAVRQIIHNFQPFTMRRIISLIIARMMNAA